jgi:anti-anti-sigma factor
MKPETYGKEDFTVIRPSADIRVQNLVLLRRKFEDVLKKKPSKIALDLENVHYIDSSGIGLIMNFARKVRTYEGFFAVFNYDDELKELLQIANVTDNIICRSTLQEAVKAM